jgi:hypothetical protein
MGGTVNVAAVLTVACGWSSSEEGVTLRAAPAVEPARVSRSERPAGKNLRVHVQTPSKEEAKASLHGAVEQKDEEESSKQYGDTRLDVER